VGKEEKKLSTSQGNIQEMRGNGGETLIKAHRAKKEPILGGREEAVRRKDKERRGGGDDCLEGQSMTVKSEGAKNDLKEVIESKRGGPKKKIQQEKRKKICKY